MLLYLKVKHFIHFKDWAKKKRIIKESLGQNHVPKYSKSFFFLTVTQNVKNCFDQKRLIYRSNVQETEVVSSHQHIYRPG